MLEAVKIICREAGAEILRFYGTAAPVTYKEDRSPLTAADQAAHLFLVKRLTQLAPAIPAVSEESSPESVEPAARSERYWLVDPLDGTKEFLKQSGDFTVNVALIQRGQPVLGVVYVPVRDLFYFAERGVGAWYQPDGAPAAAIHTTTHPVRERLRVVASKDHAGPEVGALLRRLPGAEVTSIGSSLKFCWVAEGKADIYPRFVPTMEWDTAAAQCIVESAGGAVLTLDGQPLTYGKAAWRNPAIVTVGTTSLGWREWLG